MGQEQINLFPHGIHMVPVDPHRQLLLAAIPYGRSLFKPKESKPMRSQKRVRYESDRQINMNSKV